MHPADPRSNLWTHTAPPGPDCPALQGERAADVAVVGGGYTGLSAALHLAEGGADVVLLEAGQPEPGHPPAVRQRRMYELSRPIFVGHVLQEMPG